VRRVLDVLHDGRFVLPLDDGERIEVERRTSTATPREAVIDFTGTSGRADTNFNAPAAVAVRRCSTCSARWSTRTSR
jgi:N-methylhydantoinase B/oxoprolinase/acetone carboxylase alpha subunit